MTSWATARADSIREVLSWYDEETASGYERIEDMDCWDVVQCVAIDALKPLALLLRVDPFDLFWELTEGAPEVEGVESVANLLDAPATALLRRFRSGRSADDVSASGEVGEIPLLAALAADFAASSADLSVRRRFASALQQLNEALIEAERSRAAFVALIALALRQAPSPLRIAETPAASGHRANGPNLLSRARAWRALGADEVVSVAA